ncbi:hypothetical protein ACUH94_03405 [Dermabacteraceae bacterium P7074]
MKNKDGMLNRRSLAKAAAWSASAVVMMGAAPKCQLSPGRFDDKVCANGWFYIDRRPTGGRANLDKGGFYFLGNTVDLPALDWVVQYIPVENNEHALIKKEREIRAEEKRHGSNSLPMKLNGDLKKTEYDPGTGIVTLRFSSEPVEESNPSGGGLLALKCSMRQAPVKKESKASVLIRLSLLPRMHLAMLWSGTTRSMTLLPQTAGTIS